MGDMLRTLFGSIFGTIIIIFVVCVIFVFIARLFKLKLNQEDFEGCFGLICAIAVGITILVYLFNQCSSP